MRNFEEVYVKHQNDVKRYIFSKVKNIQTAEDITADTFIKVLKHLPEYNSSKSQLITWLFNIANNTLIDYYRTSHRDKWFNVDNFVSKTGRELFQIPDKRYIYTVENRELREKIRQSFRKLNPNHKNIAYLYFLRHKQYDEIALICQIPLGSVKGMLSRIREKLQAEIKPMLCNK